MCFKCLSYLKFESIMLVCVSVTRNNRCGGGGAVSEGRHHNEGFPSQQRAVSPWDPTAAGRPPSSGAAVHEAW